ncbi:MAG: hypothetical protein ACI3X7_03360 [Bacteroidaceae bacterium]
MKKYISPVTTVTTVEGCHILANSLGINDTPVDGQSALQKEEDYDDWDIWE